jgi:hypothetical protein
VGWTNRPNVHTTINTGERTATVITDSDGFRIGRAGRSIGSEHVLLIGDSFAQALQVDYEKSFAYLIERGLTARRGHPVAVWDAGVDGWDPPQYLYRARQLLSTRPVAMVLVSIYLGNDIVSSARPLPPRNPAPTFSFHVPRQLSRSELVTDLLRPIDDILKRHSELYILAKNSLKTTEMRWGLTGIAFPDELLRSSAGSKRWQVTAALCDSIAQFAAQHGARTMFVLIPAPYQVDDLQLKTFARGFGIDLASVDLDQPNRLLGDAMRRRGLTVLDPLSDFRRRARNGEQLYGYVDRHLTPAGHVALSAAVVPAIASAMASTP